MKMIDLPPSAEDQDVETAVEQLEDRELLQLADAERPRGRAWVELEARRRCLLCHLLLDLPSSPRVRAQDDVLGHSEPRHEPEVLVHDSNAGGKRGPGRAGWQGPAADRDGPGVGTVLSAQDRYQGRLAGAVLAKQGANLACFQRQVDVVVGEAVAERLSDSPDLQDGCRGLGGGSRVRSRPRGSSTCQHLILGAYWLTLPSTPFTKKVLLV